MAGFLEGYGVADARRSRRFWRLVMAGGLLAALGLTGYFLFRSWPAKRKVSEFLEHLRNKDYQAAYRLWGCAAPDSPCRDYTFDKFMEDWGPNSTHADPATVSIVRTRYCGPGVIVTLRSGSGPELPIWYERKDATIGFAPWPDCVPQPKAYQ